MSKDTITSIDLVKWAVRALIFLTPIALLAVGFGYCTSVASTIRKEVDPGTVLKRYEWFIETAAAVEEQDATLDAFKAMATGDPTKMPRDMRRDFALRQAEIRGVLANRNRLAREYRAAIKKINYAPAKMLPHFPPTIPNYKLD